MSDQRWSQVRWVLVGLYVLLYIWWFFTRGIIINHLLVLSSVGLFLIVTTIGRPARRWLQMVGDFLLFAAMWLAYAESRGFADRFDFPIQVESVRNIDRALFFGTDGVVWLQERFLAPPGTVRWYDVVASMVYYSHFILPPVTIGALWFLSRPEWARYMRRFATMLLVGCAMFVVLPTAPPWMAGGGSKDPDLQFDALPPLRRPTGNGWRHIGLDAAVQAWDTGRDWANPVAAMPSLHCAFALFFVVFMFKWVTDWRWRALMLLYPLAMSITLMYFGEHYFADALAGWAIVGASFWAWNRIERRWSRRRAASVRAEGDPGPGPDASPAEAQPTDVSASEQAEVAATVDVELHT